MEWSPLVPELLVTDLARSRAFWTGVLGARELFGRDDPPFAYLQLGRAQVMLEQDHATAWVTGPLDAPRGRGINLQIEVDDVDAVAGRARAAGPLFREVHESWYDVAGGREGQRELLVQDPDGYLVRLVQPLPPPDGP